MKNSRPKAESSRPKVESSKPTLKSSRPKVEEKDENYDEYMVGCPQLWIFKCKIW